MLIVIIVAILMIACFIFGWIDDAYNREVMGGETKKRLIWWRNLKSQAKDWWSKSHISIKLFIIGFLLFLLFIILWTSTPIFSWIDRGHRYPQVYHYDENAFVITKTDSVWSEQSS